MTLDHYSSVVFDLVWPEGAHTHWLQSPTNWCRRCSGPTTNCETIRTQVAGGAVAANFL